MYPECRVVLYLEAIQNIKVIQIYEFTEIPMDETHFFERFDNRCFVVFNIQLIPMSISHLQMRKKVTSKNNCKKEVTYFL